MRIGNAYNLLQINKNLGDARVADAKALEPLSTGRRINHLSDDPSHLATYFRTSNDIERVNQYLLNVNTAQTRVDVTDGVLTQVNELLQEANDIALQGNTQLSSADEITAMTTRLADIKAEIKDLGNTKLGSNYLFSGYSTSTQPFQNDPVTFNGDSNTVYVKVTSTKQVQTSVDGDTVFTGAGGGVDVFAAIDSLITNIQAQDETAVGADITSLQTARDQVQTARSTMGNSGIALSSTSEFLENLSLTDSKQIADISDVDVATATTELSFREFALKSALAVASRVMQITLQSFFDN